MATLSNRQHVALLAVFLCSRQKNEYFRVQYWAVVSKTHFRPFSCAVVRKTGVFRCNTEQSSAKHAKNTKNWREFLCNRQENTLLRDFFCAVVRKIAHTRSYADGSILRAQAHNAASTSVIAEAVAPVDAPMWTGLKGRSALRAPAHETSVRTALQGAKVCAIPTIITRTQSINDPFIENKDKRAKG